MLWYGLLPIMGYNIARGGGLVKLKEVGGFVRKGEGDNDAFCLRQSYYQLKIYVSLSCFIVLIRKLNFWADFETKIPFLYPY